MAGITESGRNAGIRKGNFIHLIACLLNDPIDSKVRDGESGEIPGSRPGSVNLRNLLPGKLAKLAN